AHGWRTCRRWPSSFRGRRSWTPSSGAGVPTAAPMTTPAGEGGRLQKVLAQLGVGSRRACEELIAAGRVSVNGEVALLGRRVDPGTDRVAVDGVPVGIRPGLVYYALNKPAGVISTASDPQRRPAVTGLLLAQPRVHP